MMRNMAIKVYESRIMAFNVSPKYLPIFCIFHNSIRKSLCLIELALMHYTKKKDMNEHLGNILHFKYQPNNFFWSAYLPVPIIHKYTFKWVVMQRADSMALS